MFDYVDYIHESSQEDIDDVDLVYNEYDMAINEFDSYVQEGVGLKILAGIGIAAALGGLIAIIIKMISSKSSDSVASNAKETKRALNDLKKKEPEAKIECEIFYGNKWEKYFKAICNRTRACSDYASALAKKMKDIVRDWNKDDGQKDISDDQINKWDKDFRFNAFRNAKDEAYTKNDIGDLTPEKLTEAFKEIKHDKAEVSISTIIDRIDVMISYNEEFRIYAKSMNNSKREIERLTNDNTVISQYMNKKYDVKNFINDISRNTALISILNTYMNDELRRIKKSAYDKLDNKTQDRLDRAIKSTHELNDELNDHSNRVNVEDIMNGKVGFDKFMDDKNSRLVFS